MNLATFKNPLRKNDLLARDSQNQLKQSIFYIMILLLLNVTIKAEEPTKLYLSNAEGFYHFGKQLENIREYKGAAEAYQKAYTLQPDSTLYIFSQARSLLLAGEVESALTLFDTIMDSIEYSSKFYVSSCHDIAKYFILRKKPERAEPYLDKAKTADSTNAETYFWLGKAKESRFDLDEAVRYYETAIELEPENSSYKNALNRIK